MSSILLSSTNASIPFSISTVSSTSTSTSTSTHTASASHSWNNTGGHFPSATQHQLSSFFMQAYKSSMAGFAVRCQLGSIVSALLCGWVYKEAYQYFRTNRDPTVSRILIGTLVLAMAIEHVLGVVDSAIIVLHFWDYAQVNRIDVNLNYAKMLTMSVIIAPATVMYFSLRAWAVNGKSAAITVLVSIGVLAQLSAGIAVVVVGFQNPYHYDGTINLEALAKASAWADTILKTFRVWATITVSTNVGTTLAIFITLARFRGKTVEIDRFLRKLAVSLLESMVPIVASAVLFCALILDDQGWGGMIRIVSELPGPLCVHAILHSLLSRDRMREMLKSISGDSSRSDDSGGMRDGTEIALGAEFLMAQKSGKAGEERSGSQNSRREGDRADETGSSNGQVSRSGSAIESKVNYDLDLDEVARQSAIRSTSSSRLPLRASSEQRIRNYYRAWEDPVHQSFSGRKKYGFTLGTSE